ncbi:MAG: hypothetical protein A3B09_03525, partial [Candidatus Taylorbacteria bacterium RIFCSPLOWO2_01_FULL_43_83]
VGQGDAIFIESPSGNQMLIDGGPSRVVLRELGKVLPFYDRKLDVILATHPDRDHIGGLPLVVRRYDVGHVLESDVFSDSGYSQALEDEIGRKKINKIESERGMVLDLGGGAYFQIFFPDRGVSAVNTNDASIVGKLVYGNISFILSGDSPKKIEEYLVYLDAGALDADVLKVGHHGSRTSSSESFIRAVSPQFAVISAAKDNNYGHPHKEVTEVLRKNFVETLNTGDTGRIIMKTDGVKLWLESKKWLR